MKTAISIPDKVFDQAEKLAARQGKSRSQLYTQAIISYLEKQNAESVTEALDEIYSSVDSSLDSATQNLQSRTVWKEKW